MTIYLDLVLLENILMNILIIYSSNYISKEKISLYKICISAIIGAVYYVVLLLPENDFLNFYIYKIGLSILMVLIGFSNKSFHDFIFNIFTLYLISFIYGGAMYSIYHFVFLETNIEYYPVKILILGAIVLTIIIRYIVKKIRCIMDYKKLTYIVDIYINNKVKRITAFLDTGNNLKDPITNKEVIVVCLNSIKDILPKEIVEMCNSDSFEFEKLDSTYINKVKILSYISIGNQNGIMLGYITDMVKINISNGNDIIINKCIIGINKTKIDNKDFDALLSIEVLESKGGYDHGYHKVEIGKISN